MPDVPDTEPTAATAVEQARAWFTQLAALQAARNEAAALFTAARSEFTAALARRGELEQGVLNNQAILNVIADSANGRAPAVAQTGTRFARVHAGPRKTGTVLAFRTEAGVSSEGPGALFFRPHGTSDEQRQYRVATSGSANPGLSIVARDDVLARSAEPRPLLPAAVPLASDAGIISDAAGDSRRFPGRGTVFRGGLRGGAARVIQDGNNLDAGSAAAVQRRLTIQGDASDREADGTADDAHAWRDWHAAPFTTFRHDAVDGWAMGFGGSGVVFADLARYAAKPEADASTLAANQDNDDVSNNIEITFGARPAGHAGLDPHLAAYYWNLKVPSLRRGADGALVDGPGRAEAARFDGGRYELLLSTYMASETELSPPPEGRTYQIIHNEDGTQSLHVTELEAGLSAAQRAAHREAGLAEARLISDEIAKLDAENHLRHAAYGLFAFSSRFDGTQRLSRLQTFHFGRQSFADTPGNRISDLSGYGVSGKRFFGRTMGWLLTGADSADKSTDSRISGRHRVRGSVQLMLDLHPQDPTAGGFILGAIDNLQIEAGPGRWTTDASGVLGAGTAAALLGTIQLNVLDGEYYHPVLSAADLTGAVEDDLENVRNDGTYSGAAVPLNPRSYSEGEDVTVLSGGGIGDFFAAGEFEGALYGPKAAIPETAGTWWVPARLDFARAEGMIGSFGAFCGESTTCSPLDPANQ